VVLNQNKTIGYQAGMGPDFEHNHRLVEMITGQWGDDVTTTSQGTFVDRTYTYSIPADYKGVEAVLENFEVVAFVTGEKDEIINGAWVYAELPLIAGLDDIKNNLLVNIYPNPVSDMLMVDLNLKNRQMLKSKYMIWPGALSKLNRMASWHQEERISNYKLLT